MQQPRNKGSRRNSGPWPVSMEQMTCGTQVLPC
jgi:hypothetical protein